MKEEIVYMPLLGEGFIKEKAFVWLWSKRFSRQRRGLFYLTHRSTVRSIQLRKALFSRLLGVSKSKMMELEKIASKRWLGVPGKASLIKIGRVNMRILCSMTLHAISNVSLYDGQFR